MLPGSRIWFGLSLGTGLGAIRPVCALTGVRPPHDAVEDVAGKEIESQGARCKVSATE